MRSIFSMVGLLVVVLLIASMVRKQLTAVAPAPASSSSVAAGAQGAVNVRDAQRRSDAVGEVLQRRPPHVHAENLVGRVHVQPHPDHQRVEDHREQDEHQDCPGQRPRPQSAQHSPRHGRQHGQDQHVQHDVGHAAGPEASSCPPTGPPRPAQRSRPRQASSAQ